MSEINEAQAASSLPPATQSKDPRLQPKFALLPLLGGCLVYAMTVGIALYLIDQDIGVMRYVVAAVAAAVTLATVIRSWRYIPDSLNDGLALFVYSAIAAVPFTNAMQSSHLLGTSVLGWPVAYVIALVVIYTIMRWVLRIQPLLRVSREVARVVALIGVTALWVWTVVMIASALPHVRP